MTAIYMREMRSYFTSPIGYIFTAIYFAVSGFCFYYMVLSDGATGSVSGYFTSLIFVFIVIVPLLTMKMFSEEKKQRTEQLLLTSPVSLWGMVGGKFFAAYTMFAASFLCSAVINAIALGIYGTPNMAVFLGNVLSVLLMGGAFIAIGTFLSSLTESQLVEALLTMFLIAVLLLVSFFTPYVNLAWLRVVMNWISIFTRFSNFAYGIFDAASLLYYLSIVFAFLFLTVRMYERKRWS